MDRIDLFQQTSLEGVSDLQLFYGELSERMDLLRHQTGFTCIEKCGKCCNVASEKIETTIFEMLPLALHFIRLNKHDEILEQLKSEDLGKDTCIMYKKLNEEGSQGYCSAYVNRPLICRLFGAAVRIKSDESKEFVMCKLLKDIVAKNPSLSDLADKMVVIQEVVGNARGLNVNLTSELYNINEGLKLAIEHILFRLRWFDPTDHNPSTNNNDFNLVA